MPVPAIVLAGAAIGARVLAVLRGSALIVVVRYIAAIGLRLLWTTVLAPSARLIWKIGIRVALFAAFYKFFTEWLLVILYDVMESALGLIPSSTHPGFTRFWQLVTATENLIPWDHIGFTIKWVVLLRLWVTTWHYMMVVLEWARRWLGFAVEG